MDFRKKTSTGVKTRKAVDTKETPENFYWG